MAGESNKGRPRPKYTLAAREALADTEPHQLKRIRNPWSDPKQVACFRTVLHKVAGEKGFKLRVFEVGDEMHLLRLT